MKVAFIIFERMTALDFIGVYDPITRLHSMGFMPDLEWEVCSLTPEVRGDKGLVFRPSRVGESLGDFDAVIVPGGYGTRDLLQDEPFLQWLATCAPCPLKVSVCTGALLLGAAGFLAGRRATTHPSAFLQLEPFCAQVDDQRIVDEGEVITARGVSAAIDLGLYLVRKFAGADAGERIARQMDYPYTACSSCL